MKKLLAIAIASAFTVGAYAQPHNAASTPAGTSIKESAKEVKDKTVAGAHTAASAVQKGTHKAMNAVRKGAHKTKKAASAAAS